MIYNCNRLIFYVLIGIVTIGIMVGIDSLLLETNQCFNTYAMFAQLFTNKSYQYLCYQNEIRYALAVAFILMITFHGLFAIFLFHIIQFIIPCCKPELLKNGENVTVKPYKYHQPSGQLQTERRKWSESDIHAGFSEDDSHSDHILQPQTYSKSVRNQTKYSSVTQNDNQDAGE